ncbi:2Fe-2S iron-sulfur cluster-binding protein [Arhodomonas sp. SL1]|uniref:2Fe-2S iron-sulfur cluster-binding protein n=1 Tax=Arhodomonas sp. SL1 TaxID=3425691 RepID=UPI003F8824A0
MSETAFRPAGPAPDQTAEVTVDGAAVALPANRSLLAGLLMAGSTVDFFCAIGQCQRCRVRVNGETVIACRYTPRPGDTIETDPT